MTRLLRQIRREEREHRRATQPPLLERWKRNIWSGLTRAYQHTQRGSPYSNGHPDQYTDAQRELAAAETTEVPAVNGPGVVEQDYVNISTDDGDVSVTLDHEIDIPIGSTSIKVRLGDLVNAATPESERDNVQDTYRVDARTDGSIDDLPEVGMMGATVSQRAAERRRRAQLRDHERRVEDMIASNLQPGATTTTRTRTEDIGVDLSTTTHQDLEAVGKRQRKSNWIVGGIAAALIAVPLYTMWSTNLRTQSRAEGFDAGIVHAHQEGFDDKRSADALGVQGIKLMDDQDMTRQHHQRERQNGHNNPQTITNLEDFLRLMRAMNPKAGMHDEKTIQLTEDFQLMCYYGLGMKEIQYDGIPGEKSFALADKIASNPGLLEQFRNVQEDYSPIRKTITFEGRAYNITVPYIGLRDIRIEHRGQQRRNLVDLATGYNPIIDKLSRDIARSIPKEKRTPEEIARKNLRFVQVSFEYEDDSGNYYKHPLESIFAQKIDCEDGAVLFMSLNYHRGIDGILVQTSTLGVEYDHLMTGTAGNFEEQGRSERVRGKDFYFSETTEGLQTNYGNGNIVTWNIGTIDPSVDWVTNPRVTMWFHTGSKAKRSSPFVWTEGHGHTYVKR